MLLYATRNAHRHPRSLPGPHDRRSGADTAAAFRDCTGFVSSGTLYTGTLADLRHAPGRLRHRRDDLGPDRQPRDPHLPLRPHRAGQHRGRGQDHDLWFLVGNAHQLTTADQRQRSARSGTSRKPAAKPWLRPVLYGAGTVSMLMISMVSSLSLWIALPWAFIGWSPTLVTTGSMEPLVTPGDVVMIRPVSAEELVAQHRGPLRAGRRRARAAPHRRAAARRHLPHPGRRQRRPGQRVPARREHPGRRGPGRAVGRPALALAVRGARRARWP